MAAQHDHDDRLADQNLRRIGKSLHLPQPTAQQRQTWKSASSDSRPELAHHHRLRAGGLSVQARRFITFSVSAVAAALALVAFIFVPPTGSTVEAATILRSLREATHNGFKLELSNVRVEGVAADFRMLIRYPQPITLAQLAKEGDIHAEPDAFFVDGTVRLPADHEDAPGLNVELAVAAREGDQWVFARVQNVPVEDLVDDDPHAQRVIEAVVKRLGDGILVDLTGLEDLLKQTGVFDGDFSVDVDEPDVDATAGEVNVRVKQSVKAKVSTGSAPNSPDSPTSASTKREIKAGLLGLGPIGDEIAKALDEAGDEIEAEITAGMAAGESEWEKAITEIAEAIFTGRATQAQLESLIAQLEKFAGNASVSQGSDDVWTLSASQFDTTGMDDDERKLMERATLSIRYREGDGVLSAELSNFGEADGRLSFEFIDGIDEKLLDRTRYIDRGVPMLDLRNPWQVMTFFGDVFSPPLDDE